MFPIIIIGLCFKSDNEFEKTAMWLKKAVMRKIGKRAIIKRINSEQTCLNIHSAQTQSFTIHFSFIRFVSFCRGIYSGQPEKLFPPLSKFFPVLGTFIGGFFKFSRFFSPPSNSSLFFNLDKKFHQPPRKYIPGLLEERGVILFPRVVHCIGTRPLLQLVNTALSVHLIPQVYCRCYIYMSFNAPKLYKG